MVTYNNKSNIMNYVFVSKILQCNGVRTCFEGNFKERRGGMWWV